MSSPGKGSADFWQAGDWNSQCFRCGRKTKATEMRKQWQGYYVCQRCWEPRHPQDFVKGVPDNTSVPWSQPDNWNFIGPGVLLCTVSGKSAIPDFMTPGCSIPATTKTDYFQ